MSVILERATRKVNAEHLGFQRKLKADTAQLQEDISDASSQVTAFAQLSDINEQVEFAARGQALTVFLGAIADRSAVINSEETLFELTRSEWPAIARLQKELQPYTDLWVRLIVLDQRFLVGVFKSKQMSFVISVFIA